MVLVVGVTSAAAASDTMEGARTHSFLIEALFSWEGTFFVSLITDYRARGFREAPRVAGSEAGNKCIE